jgi:hypothetical protein
VKTEPPSGTDHKLFCILFFSHEESMKGAAASERPPGARGVGGPVTISLSRDGKLLFAARVVRMFAFGERPAE